MTRSVEINRTQEINKEDKILEAVTRAASETSASKWKNTKAVEYLISRTAVLVRDAERVAQGNWRAVDVMMLVEELEQTARRAGYNKDTHFTNANSSLFSPTISGLKTNFRITCSGLPRDVFVKSVHILQTGGTSKSFKRVVDTRKQNLTLSTQDMAKIRAASKQEIHPYRSLPPNTYRPAR